MRQDLAAPARVHRGSGFFETRVRLDIRESEPSRYAQQCLTTKARTKGNPIPLSEFAGKFQIETVEIDIAWRENNRHDVRARNVVTAAQPSAIKNGTRP